MSSELNCHSWIRCNVTSNNWFFRVERQIPANHTNSYKLTQHGNDDVNYRTSLEGIIGSPRKVSDTPHPPVHIPALFSPPARFVSTPMRPHFALTPSPSDANLWVSWKALSCILVKLCEYWVSSNVNIGSYGLLLFFTLFCRIGWFFMICVCFLGFLCFLRDFIWFYISCFDLGDPAPPDLAN